MSRVSGTSLEVVALRNRIMLFGWMGLVVERGALMAEANFSTADRLVHVLDHLGIERAHFAASMLADVIDFARTHSERIASLTLVCPPRLDPSLRALGPRLLIIAGD